MVGAAFFALFSPIPGSVLVAVALIVVIAEVHRAISKRDSLCKTGATELDRSMNCAVVLQWNATPAELTNLGALNGVELRDRKATGWEEWNAEKNN
jgi:hypothetical protein